MVGYNARNKQILSEKFICLSCTLILRNPVHSSECGHRLCESCINKQENMKITCAKCRAVSSKNPTMIIDRAFQTDMNLLPIECYFCGWINDLKSYQAHLNEAHRDPVCQYCNKHFNSVDNFNDHIVHECKKVTVSCIFKEYGCNELIVREQMEEHYSTSLHQKTILKMLATMKSNLEIPSPVMNHVQVLYQALDNDHRHLSDESVRIHMGVQTLVEQLNKTRYISSNGTFIWKITNFRENMMDAQSERQTSIYSPPFYSSPTGYKMRARLFLQRDGDARRTHMSVYFVLMKYDYDAILKFPFDYEVTFCLCDQSGAQKHIIHSFRPNISRDTEIASGISQFLPLSMIQQEGNPYVRDDTMLIKIIVDFFDKKK